MNTAGSARMRVTLIMLAVAVLSACATVGEDYVKPAVRVPDAFEHNGPWKEAAPGDLRSRGEWWRLFVDPTLDDLEARAIANSPTLAAYAARVDQARAVAGIAGSFASPEVVAGVGAGRFRASENRPDQPEKRPGNRAYESGAYRVPLSVSYELDLWGRVRRLTESARARADASLDEYKAAQLTVEAEVAHVYFRVRQADEEMRLLEENISLQRRAHGIIVARRKAGIASELDLARADAELALTEAAADDAGRRRTDLLLALATLVGEWPEGFSVAPRRFDIEPPPIPVGLPSELLERRPDVAHAERTLAARNAEIGVARAAYFPAIRLTAAAGFESGELTDLIKADSFVWSLGASLFQPIFNGGRIGFDVDRARAAHAEAIALYRARLLNAFREVEASLAALGALERQWQHQQAARESASKVVRLADARYRGGLVAALEVIDAQRTQLRADREALAVRTNQLAFSVSLIKALGGGWAGRNGGIEQAALR